MYIFGIKWIFFKQVFCETFFFFLIIAYISQVTTGTFLQ